MNERMAASCPKSVTLTKGEHQDGKGVGTTNELLLFLPQARATQKGCGFSGEVASEQSDDFAERMIYLTSFDVCYFVSFFFWLVFWECHLFFGLCFFLLFLFWSILQVYLSQTSDEPISQLNAAWRATNYLHQKIIYKILRAIGHSSIKSIRHGQNSQRISPLLHLHLKNRFLGIRGWQRRIIWFYRFLVLNFNFIQRYPRYVVEALWWGARQWGVPYPQ